VEEPQPILFAARMVPPVARIRARERPRRCISAQTPDVISQASCRISIGRSLTFCSPSLERRDAMRLRPDRHKRLQFQCGFPFERGFRIAQSEASGDGWELPRTTRPSWWSSRGLLACAQEVCHAVEVDSLHSRSLLCLEPTSAHAIIAFSLLTRCPSTIPPVFLIALKPFGLLMKEPICRFTEIEKLSIPDFCEPSYAPHTATHHHNGRP